MRIRYWSSDVCSSDLRKREAGGKQRRGHQHFQQREPALRVHRGGRRGVQNEPPPNASGCESRSVCSCRLWRGPPSPHSTSSASSISRAAPGSMVSRVRAVGSTRSEEHTSELQSLMRISYAVFCLKKKKNTHK